jgi:hypothetical protein
MHDKTFSQYEREGWQRNAADYDAIDLPATRQAIAPLLDSVGDLHGRRMLEVASGTGHLAEHALARGATVIGVDVAGNMLELARQRVPGATCFVESCAAQPSARGGVRHRERIAIYTVSGAGWPCAIGRPDRVRRTGVERRGSRMRRPAPPRLGPRQPRGAEALAGAAGGRPLEIGAVPSQGGRIVRGRQRGGRCFASNCTAATAGARRWGQWRGTRRFSRSPERPSGT